MIEVRLERCEYCDSGWVDGRPEPTPDGPYYPTYRCAACDGNGWTEIEYAPFTEDDAIDRDAMLAAMGEDEDSLVHGGSGGGERDPGTRCERDEIDCRANGCERGPCPMEYVG